MPEARPAVPAAKICSKCGRERASDQFYAHSNTADGLGAWCRPCYADKYRVEKTVRAARKKARREADVAASRAAEKQYRDSNKDRIRELARKRTYGVSAEQYAEMVQRCGGKCSICKSATTSALCIDHDHKTGAVRDLLCGNCNRALGKFQDDPRLLRAAAEYLEKHQADDGSSLSGSPRECLAAQAVV